MTQQAGFTQFYVGDITNTLNDLSIYVKTIKVPLNAGTVDLTSLVSGATNAPTTQMKRAQIQSDVSITLFDDLGWYGVVEQIINYRTGTTLKVQTGKNALPSVGDIIFYGTFTLFSVTSDWTTKKDATSVLNFKPSDGGLIAPAIIRY